MISPMMRGFSLFFGAALMMSCTGNRGDKISLPDAHQASAHEPKTAAPVSDDANAANKSEIKETQVATAEAPVSNAPAQASSSPEAQKARVSGAIVAAKQGQASFQVAGHIEKTMVNVGDRVKKGQVLASLDNSDYVLRGKIAKVQVEQAQIALEQARRDMERENQLKREGATTQANFERVSNQLASAQLALTQAQLNQQQLQDQVGDTQLVASYDGVISRRLKVEGEWVGVGNPVFEVSGSGEVEVSLRMPESLLRRVNPGQKVPLTIPSIEKVTEMEVLRIVPVIQENSRTFELIGKVSRADASIVPGQFVEAQF
jgi:membrane fusion protein, multidrug efflux system